MDGKPVAGLPPQKRDLGMVFQSYAVFPHLTVFDNIAFPLEIRRARRAEIRQRVGEALELVRLTGYDAAAAAPALGRRAAASGAGPRAGVPPARAPDGRAARRARQEAARPHAARAEAHPAAPARDGDLRHPRPGRSAHDVGPRGRDAARPDRAGGHAGRAVRGAGQSIRGGLPRRVELRGRRGRGCAHCRALAGPRGRRARVPRRRRGAAPGGPAGDRGRPAREARARRGGGRRHADRRGQHLQGHGRGGDLRRRRDPVPGEPWAPTAR